MRPVAIAAVSLAFLTPSCGLEPQTVSLEPTEMHVARYVHHYRTGVCVGLDRVGGLPSIYADWVASLPVDADRAEVLVGRSAFMDDGESCDTWVHSLFQGIVFFDVSRLPEGIVTDATIFFDRTPVFEAGVPSDDCLFEVGAATEDARLREVSRVAMPQLSFADAEDRIEAQDSWLIGPRESSADVSVIVGRWDLGVRDDFGFAFTPFVRDFAEQEIACAHRLENFRLQVTLETPIES